MEPAKISYKIYQGSTFQESYRWESETKVYVPIDTVSKSAPCVVLTEIPHNLPVGWRFRVVGVAGMKEINNGTDEFYIATDAYDSTIQINSVNSLNYATYTSGGIVEYGEPVDLAPYTAKMQIRKTVNSDEVIYETDSSEAGDIVIDNVYKTISINIPAETTAAFNFASAVYAVELHNSDGSVTPFLTGILTLVPEIVR